MGELKLPSADFWQGRRVLLTGHTGFKGAWTALWLAKLGADVTGLSLAPHTEPSLYELAGLEKQMVTSIADLEDIQAVERVVAMAQPQIVIHMAAQALVPVGLREPRATFATNVMGTVHLLEAVLRRTKQPPEIVLVVTSDKVYSRSDNIRRAFVESDKLGGSEPYSASKAAVEMVAAAYRDSVVDKEQTRIIVARGGNVVGGGDFSESRLVPDIWRACRAQTSPKIRMPQATRPWQHVLDCVAGYLRYIECAAAGDELPPALNFGPDKDGDSVGTVTARMLELLGSDTGCQDASEDVSAEHSMLHIDASLARRQLDWQPRLADDRLWEWTAAWYDKYNQNADMGRYSLQQLESFKDL